jgi:hypothetical protein
MADFPISLDTLIRFVDAVRPEGDPLEHLADAVTVGQRLQDQADALIGHYVDQARRAGASWSQIGVQLGVSKQAVQQRFVARADVPAGARTLERFAPRAKNVLVVARVLAAVAVTPARSGSATAEGADADAARSVPVEPRHLVAAMTREPESIALRAIRRLGLSDETLLHSLGVAELSAAETPAGTAERLVEATFDLDTKRLLARALDIALHFGHNYIGTEHLLLSATSEGPTKQPLAKLGLTDDALKPVIEELIEEAKASRA